MSGRLARLLVLLALTAGIALRVVHLRDWPKGPWIDEAYAMNAARDLSRDPHASLFGVSPLEPKDAGFVNFYVPNAYLFATAAVDRVAGGGIDSLRAASVLPALLLLVAAVGLAWEAAGERHAAIVFAAILAASSMWLLTTGRWGWHAVTTSAFVVLAVWLLLAADRRVSLPLAACGGLFLGLAQYGYPAARLAIAPPLLLLGSRLVRKEGAGARRVLAFLAAAVLAAAPVLVEMARHPDRVLARERELSQGAGPSLALRNVVDYAALFLVRGDDNERHGDPRRPVLPAPTVGFLLVGAGMAVTRRGPERTLALWAAAFLLGGLLSRGGANAYRISPAAPFLLVLSALGAAALVEAFGAKRRPGALTLVTALVVVSAVADVAGFASWARSPRTWGAFGGPERELADAFREERHARPAALVIDPRSGARNYHVVDALLGSPRDDSPRLHPLDLTRLPAAARLTREALYADGGALETSGRLEGLRGRVVRRGVDPWGTPTWVLYRLSASSSAR